MRAKLLTSGADLFGQQSNEDIEFVQFTGFRLGSTKGPAETMDRDITAPLGTLVYTGTENQISYTPMSDDMVLITAIVPRGFAQIEPGNIVFYGNDDTAMFGAIAESSILKLQMNEGNAGTQLTYTFILRMPGLMDRFDFTNLQARTAEFQRYDNDFELTRWPYEEASDQIIVEADARIEERPALVIIAMGQLYWGMPLNDWSDDDAFMGTEE
jgi:hypothetical protein